MNCLFSNSWDNYVSRSFEYLRNSLFFICCYSENTLVGFVNVVSDGLLHAFILDVTVSPERRLKGIGTALVKLAIDECKKRGVEWVHVDYEHHLEDFYSKCGFKNCKAGVINLKNYDK